MDGQPLFHRIVGLDHLQERILGSQSHGVLELIQIRRINRPVRFPVAVLGGWIKTASGKGIASEGLPISINRGGQRETARPGPQ